MTDLLDLVHEADTKTRMADALAVARGARDEGMARAEASDEFGWDKSVIDTAIGYLADSGAVFSANDLRELLPDVHQPLIGSRMRGWATSKRIKHVSYTASTLESTHAHEIKTWQGIKEGDPA